MNIHLSLRLSVEVRQGVDLLHSVFTFCMFIWTQLHHHRSMDFLLTL